MRGSPANKKKKFCILFQGPNTISQSGIYTLRGTSATPLHTSNICCTVINNCTYLTVWNEKGQGQRCLQWHNVRIKFRNFVNWLQTEMESTHKYHDYLKTLTTFSLWKEHRSQNQMNAPHPTESWLQLIICKTSSKGSGYKNEQCKALCTLMPTSPSRRTPTYHKRGFGNQVLYRAAKGKLWTKSQDSISTPALWKNL